MPSIRPKRILPLVFLLALGLFFSYDQTLKRADWLVYDLLLTRFSRPPADNIVIIAIDEQSLAAYGSWPWSRDLHAALIDKLSEANAVAIGFDVIIAEPNHNDPQSDLRLAEAIERNGRVIVPVFAEWDANGHHLRLTRPLDEIARGAAGLGHVDVELDADGIMRRAFLKAGLGTPEWQSFALAMLNVSRQIMDVSLPGARNSELSNASSRNWVRDYEVLVPFSGKPGHYSQIPYHRFLAEDFDPSVISGKFVLIGLTAAGLTDALPTPVSGESVPMSGVEINANLLDSLANDNVIVPMGTKARLVLTAIIIIVPLLICLTLPQRAVQLTLAASLLAGMVICLLFFIASGIWYPPAAALLILGLSYPVWAWNRLEDLVRKLFKERERAFVTLHSIGDSVITTDEACRVEYMNPAAVKLTGYSNQEAKGLTLQELFPLSTGEHGFEPCTLVSACIDQSEIIHVPHEVHFCNRKDEEIIVQVTAGPLLDGTGRALGAIFSISDVTEKRKALQRLSHQATHDRLTDLPNRSLLFDRLKQAISRAGRSGTSAAVLFLDLDNFKKVNDQLGHLGGDRLLQMVTERLNQVCESGDTVARLGGDEFALLLEDLSDLRTAATRADTFLQLLRSPFIIDGTEFFMTGSIGLSVYPKDGSTPEALMKNADIAVYEAKKNGRNTYLFFSDEMNQAVQHMLLIEAQLRAAMNRSELELYYQPQVRLEDQRIIGVEALLRWISKDEIDVSPATFIPVAEETGLILPLSDWVIRTACLQAKTWQDELGVFLPVSINISPRHFREENLHLQLQQIINEAGVSAAQVELEITETMLMQDVRRSTEILHDFRQLGGTITIDDFGTGYSSLSYLKNFPLDKLKIDKTFIDDIDRNKKDEGLAKTIITMGHGLGLTVVAEGVETAEQLEKLRELECDIIQGYYFCPPLPAASLTDKLKHSLFFTKIDNPGTSQSPAHPDASTKRAPLS